MDGVGIRTQAPHDGHHEGRHSYMRKLESVSIGFTLNQVRLRDSSFIKAPAHDYAPLSFHLGYRRRSSTLGLLKRRISPIGARMSLRSSIVLAGPKNFWEGSMSRLVWLCD